MVNDIKSPNWINISVLVLTPLLAMSLLPWHAVSYGIEWMDVANFVFFYTVIGLSITAGYHRYLAHRAYECHPILQFLFLFFGAGALQNSALNWVSDHRYHHRHVDSEEDPYNIQKGFFWAHMGWVFFDKPVSSTRFDNVRDLSKQRLIQWQNKYYIPIAVVSGFVLPTLLGACFGRPLAGLLWGGLLRLVVGHHTTFLINSAAHFFGKQPHSDAHSARDSWWLGFFSFGEGYHNFHHTYPSDYRNGVAWYHWDLTKWLIRGLSIVGLTSQLRRMRSIDPSN